MEGYRCAPLLWLSSVYRCSLRSSESALAAGRGGIRAKSKLEANFFLLCARLFWTAGISAFWQVPVNSVTVPARFGLLIAS